MTHEHLAVHDHAMTSLSRDLRSSKINHILSSPGHLSSMDLMSYSVYLRSQIFEEERAPE